MLAKYYEHGHVQFIETQDIVSVRTDLSGTVFVHTVDGTRTQLPLNVAEKLIDHLDQSPQLLKLNTMEDSL